MAIQILKQVNKLIEKITLGSLNTSLLHNKWILYSVLLLSLVNAYTHLVIGNYRFLATFFLVGFLTAQFSKNMMVILLVSLTVANALKRVWTGSEGFETNEESSMNKEQDVVEKEDEKKEEVREKKETDDAVKSELEDSLEVKKLLEDKGNLDKLKKDAEDLLSTQKEILEGLNKMEPLLNRAEKLSEKFSTRK
jgi:hypothetical protein